MNKKHRPHLTIKFLRLMYLMSRKPTKRNKVHCVYGGKMDEGEYNRCMEILNDNKK